MLLYNCTCIETEKDELGNPEYSSNNLASVVRLQSVFTKLCLSIGLQSQYPINEDSVGGHSAKYSYGRAFPAMIS